MERVSSGAAVEVEDAISTDQSGRSGRKRAKVWAYVDTELVDTELVCCRYFSEPDNMVQKAHHDAIFSRIVNDSITFHFWNGITSALVPEASSLVSKILDHYCIRCLDVL